MNVFLSFDDGRLDFYTNVFPILKKHYQVATIHITTGFIDGSYNSDDFGVNRKPVTIEQLIEMKKYGIGISSHGDKHILDNDDFLKSIEKMITWGLSTEGERVGYSVPNSKYSKTQINSFVLANREKIKYVRVGRHPKCYTLFSKISYFFYHYIFKNRLSFALFNKHNVFSNKNIESDLLYSVVVKKDCKLKHLEYFLSKHSKKSANIILMFHSIVEKAGETWEWNAEDFDNLIEFCLQNNISIKRLEDL